MDKKITMLLLVLANFGCATSFKSEMKTNPMTKLTGGNTYVKVMVDGKEIDSSFAGIIKDEAYQFLEKKGFHQVQSPADAHFVVIFNPGERSRDVQVPGQTYLVPVYNNNQNNQSYTSTVTNQYGQQLGTVHTQQNSNPYNFSPSDYKTMYREGYNATIVDQWLMVYGMVQKHGDFPQDMFEGQIYRTSNNVEFFSSESAIRNAVKSLLAKSSINNLNRVPAATDNKRPGCRKRLGWQTDFKVKQETKEDVVSIVEPTSGAKAADIRPGDKITRVDGKPYDDFFANRTLASRAYAKGTIEVELERDGKQMSKKVTPKLICDE